MRLRDNVRGLELTGHGVEVTGHGPIFAGVDLEVNDAYNQLSSVKDANLVQVWLYDFLHLGYQVNWILNHIKHATDPLASYYHVSSKTGKVAPHVQRNQLRPIPEEYPDPFDNRTSYHNFADFGIMNGNAEAYNAELAFKLAKDLRNTKIVMGVFKLASSTGDYYQGQLCIPNIEDRSQLFKEHDQLVIYDAPGPAATEGEKNPRTTSQDGVLSCFLKNLSWNKLTSQSFFDDLKILNTLFTPRKCELLPLLTIPFLSITSTSNCSSMQLQSKHASMLLKSIALGIVRNRNSRTSDVFS